MLVQLCWPMKRIKQRTVIAMISNNEISVELALLRGVYAVVVVIYY